jgi:hypothetical protein
MPNRKERRWAFKQRGFLKIKNMYSRFNPTAVQWYAARQDEGRKIHAANVEAVEKANYEFLLQRETLVKENLVATGYNEAETELMLEAWRIAVTTTKEDYRQNKKEARDLTRQAQESFKSRQTA